MLNNALISFSVLSAEPSLEQIVQVQAMAEDMGIDDYEIIAFGHSDDLLVDGVRLLDPACPKGAGSTKEEMSHRIIEVAIGDYIVIWDPEEAPASIIPALMGDSASVSHIGNASHIGKSSVRFAKRALSGRSVGNLSRKLFYSLYRLMLRRDLSDYGHSLIMPRSVGLAILNLGKTITLPWPVLLEDVASISLIECPSGTLGPKTIHRSASSVGAMSLGAIVSTTIMPLRIASLSSLLAAFGNIIYSVYAVAIYLLKDDVAPGWTTTSLQMSVSFFFIALIMVGISEYLIVLIKENRARQGYYKFVDAPSNLSTLKGAFNIESQQQK